jgi:hypothetical protein
VLIANHVGLLYPSDGGNEVVPYRLAKQRTSEFHSGPLGLEMAPLFLTRSAWQKLSYSLYFSLLQIVRERGAKTAISASGTSAGAIEARILLAVAGK